MRHHIRTAARRIRRWLPLRLQLLERRDVPSTVLDPLYKIFHPEGENPAGNPAPVGLIPSQIRHAYGIDTILLPGGGAGDGLGATIAIVDAFDNPSFVSSTDPNFVNSDLHKFDMQFGIPDPPSFDKMDQTGGTAYPPGNKVWGTEIALDVEWAHATAPGASIILIEANNSSSANLYPAAQFVAGQPGVIAVSMSFGHQEVASDPADNGYFVTPAGHIGVTFLAATGDGGASGAEYPAYAPTVVAVGGTTLNLGPGNIYGSETGWSGSGGGVSLFQGNPPFQTAASALYTPIPAGGGAGGKRSIPDVAFDADPASGVAVLDSFSQGAAAPWIQVGGTSYSTPSWAGLIVIADQGRSIVGLSSLNGANALSNLYSLPPGDYHDVTSGNNGFPAGVGYDPVTGIGSPVIPALINDLIYTGPAVTNTNDDGPGSLRYALLIANVTAGTQTVTFDTAVFDTFALITLTSGAIPITDNVIIQGPGSSLLRVSGNNSSERIFTIDKSGSSGNSIIISGMDIYNGKMVGGYGGGIYDEDEALTLNDVIVENNTASDFGGGIYVHSSAGSLNMTNCVVRNNFVTGTFGSGGGIYVGGNMPITMDGCTVSGNKAQEGGGGIYFYLGGTLMMTNCTVSGNTAIGANASDPFNGCGGIYLYGTNATITNSTISGNTASLGRGGGIVLLSGSTLLIQNSTVAFNSSAGDGGGIDVASGNTVTAVSTIIAKNTHAGSPDVFGAITENFGMIFDATGATITGANNINGVDPQLGALAFNGGPTQTHALASTSPAINKGSNPTGATFDQRGAGYPRAFNSMPGIGAFEFVPSSFLVVNTNDDGPGSLREAVNESSAAVGFQSINFDTAGVFATAQTIHLTTGQLNVTDGTTINGTGSGNLTVDAGGLSRVFFVDAAGSGNAINIIGMTISGGSAVATGAGIFNQDEALTLSDVAVKNNTASQMGGGINVNTGAGSLTMNNGQVSNNVASTGTELKNGDGGGVFVNENSVITLNSCTVSGNTASDDGGGVYFYFFGTLNLNNSTVSGNTAKSGDGGGIYLFDSVANILNSTISGNIALSGGGGGIAAFYTSTEKIQNTTIAFNTAAASTTGGGIWNQSGTLSIESTIIAKNTNTGAPDVGGKVTENFSLIGNVAGATVSGANNVNGVDPLLGPLANNGGPTQSIKLLPGSACIDAGSNPASLSFDQRGSVFARVYGSAPDIGAFEVQPSSHVQSVQINDGSAQRSRVTSLTVTFDQPVTLPANPAAALTLTRQSDSAVVAMNGSVTGNSVTLTFAGGPVDFNSLADGRYTLSALASQINSTNFDGNGDGTPGDDYTLVGSPANGLFRLFGDSNGDGTVNGTGFLAFRLAFLGSGSTFDFDNDGTVSGTDFLQFRLRFLQTI